VSIVGFRVVKRRRIVSVKRRRFVDAGAKEGFGDMSQQWRLRLTRVAQFLNALMEGVLESFRR
jgi:hypothetical protein